MSSPWLLALSRASIDLRFWMRCSRCSASESLSRVDVGELFAQRLGARTPPAPGPAPLDRLEVSPDGEALGPARREGGLVLGGHFRALPLGCHVNTMVPIFSGCNRAMSADRFSLFRGGRELPNNGR